MKLKICGMKYNTTEVSELQPDFLGFIFYEKSPRNFEGETFELSQSIKKVGVFVDAEMEVILEKTTEFNLDSIQLHGKESPEYCQNLIHFCHSALDTQSRKLEIIKVFSIKDEFDFSILEPYEAVCDYFLFDTKGKLPGGNGYAFDWNVLKNYPSKKPFFLSGGIGPGEIEKLQEFLKSEAATHCYAIDVNSKFEIKPGLKKIEELKKFKSLL